MVPDVLPRVRPYLRAAYLASGNNYDEPVMLKELSKARLALWVAVREDEQIFDAAMTTRIYQLEGSRVCQIVALGGRHMPQWIEFMQLIEAYARNMACDRMRVEGRVGWTRKLPSFVRVGVILEKRVRDDG